LNLSYEATLSAAALEVSGTLAALRKRLGHRLSEKVSELEDLTIKDLEQKEKLAALRIAHGTGTAYCAVTSKLLDDEYS